MDDELIDVAAGAPPHGLAGWMRRVVTECDRAAEGFEPEPVHDLRVALRRCRSIADAMERLDPDTGWRTLKRTAKPLFRVLGELRDEQVTAELAQRLAPPGDDTLVRLLSVLADRDERLRRVAAEALEAFDRRGWKSLARRLPRRAARLRTVGGVYEALAVDRWMLANDLHCRALASRSRIAWHRLRVAVKRFRYTLENFLPRRYERWGTDLRRFQDLLGELHDLDLLQARLARLRPVLAPVVRASWYARIDSLRHELLAEYRAAATGLESAWTRWREGLPDGGRLRAASLDWLAAWGSFLDPEPARARHVRRLACDLAQGLYSAGLGEVWGDAEAVRLLEAAALLQDVGRARRERRHHKRAWSLIRDLAPPPGWTADELRQTALVARYHRGAEPDPRHKGYRDLDDAGRRRVDALAAVLRLANALEPGSGARVLGADIDAATEVIRVSASGYESTLDSSARIARGKHLLEGILGRPIVVGPRLPRPKLALVPRSLS